LWPGVLVYLHLALLKTTDPLQTALEPITFLFPFVSYLFEIVFVLNSIVPSGVSTYRRVVNQ